MLDRLIRDLRYLLLNKDDPVLTWINYLSLFLLVWALIPESIYYNWFLWMGGMGLWLLLVLFQQKLAIIRLIFQRGLWLLAIWPGYTLLLWLMGRGVLHRKFIAIALMMVVGMYYLVTQRKRELAILAKLGTALLSLIAATSLIQMISLPQIARQLATGRMTGNYQASALLASFQTVYGVVLVALVLTGLAITDRSRLNRIVSLVLMVLLIVFAGYDIALIGLVLGLGLLLIWFFGRKWRRRELVPEAYPTTEWLGISLLYALPALAMWAMKSTVYPVIDAMDYRSLPISEKLFNRIWVYLRSIYLFLEYPILGFGVEPDPTSFLSGQHSDYFEILAEYGIVGFTVFLLSWIALLMIIRSRLPHERRAIFWVSIIVFHFIFMLNPVFEVLTAAIVSIVLPGLLLRTQADTELRGVK